MTRPRLKFAALCALALLALGVLAGCGKSSNKPGETVREGLSTPLGGLRYTVFITRMLNLKSNEDRGFVPGHKEAPPGKALYGVFLQACNESDKQAIAASRFYVEDTQGNRFTPEGLSSDTVPAKNCEPRKGSLAQQSAPSGAMLLFQLPQAATENRPLTLHIEGPFNAASGKPDEAKVTLDL
jgi:hypothetical protein